MDQHATPETARRPVILSGIQPSGQLMIGNYLGAMLNWVRMQEDHECFYMLVDLHAITVWQKPADLRRNTLECLALYLAAGIDPERHTVFIQSHVPEHSELAWILNCITPLGQLQRMTQFKDKSRKHAKDLNAGLLNYPVLMAADILLYNADRVPVGEDQKQHLELARDVAQRFNHLYSATFTVPEPWIPPRSEGSRVMSLQDPLAKMSKSDPDPGGVIFLLDKPAEIKAKIRRAVTDSGDSIAYDPDKRPGVSNLMTLFKAATGESFESLEDRFAGKGYGAFKEELGEALACWLLPMQTRCRELLGDKSHLEALLRQGAEKARHRAARMLSKVQRKVGFVQL